MLLKRPFKVATYWTTALLSYFLCPILMEFEASGDFTIATRLRTSIRRNAVFYVAYTAILCLLLIILIIRGEVQGDIQSWCIAASNAWGLFVLTVLMGFGLVAVPRHFWSLANPSTLLQDLYVNAVLKDEIRLSRLFELQDTVAQARSELAAHVELEEDAPGLHMQRLAFAKLCQVADRCEMLHRELSGCRISSPLVGTRSEKTSGGLVWFSARCKHWNRSAAVTYANLIGEQVMPTSSVRLATYRCIHRCRLTLLCP